jgi:hypothetical protein
MTQGNLAKGANMTIWAIISTLSGIFIPLFTLYIYLYSEKNNAVKVISYYDNLLKLKLRSQQPNNVVIMELDPSNRIKYTLKLIPYAPYLPFSNVLKHLKSALERSEGFVKKCNDNYHYIFKSDVDEILAQRDACIQFYFMAEMLTCNSLKYRKRLKEWEHNSSYVRNHFINLIPNIVQIRRSD